MPASKQLRQVYGTIARHAYAGDVAALATACRTALRELGKKDDDAAALFELVWGFVDESGFRLAHIAAARNYLGVLEWLTSADVVPSDARQRVASLLCSRSASGNTPLMLACKEGHVDVCRFLVREAAAASVVDRHNKQDDSPLFFAVSDRPENLAVVELLLAATEPLAAILHRNRLGFNAVHVAASRGAWRCLAVFFDRLLAAAPAASRLAYSWTLHLDAAGNSMLHLAVASGSIPTVQRVLDFVRAMPHREQQLRLLHLRNKRGQLPERVPVPDPRVAPLLAQLCTTARATLAAMPASSTDLNTADSLHHETNCSESAVNHDTIDNQNIDNNTIDNQNIDNNTIDNNTIDNNTIDNHNIDNDNIHNDNHNIDKDTIDNDNHKIDNDTIDQDNDNHKIDNDKSNHEDIETNVASRSDTQDSDISDDDDAEELLSAIPEAEAVLDWSDLVAVEAHIKARDDAAYLANKMLDIFSGGRGLDLGLSYQDVFDWYFDKYSIAQLNALETFFRHGVERIVQAKRALQQEKEILLADERSQLFKDILNGATGDVLVVSFNQLALVSGSSCATLAVWQAPDQSGGIRTLRSAPDGSALAVGTDLDKRLWLLSLPDLAVRSSVEFPKRLNDCMWTVDSQRLCVGDKVGDCYCIEAAGAATADLKRSIILGHLSTITGLAMDAGSRYLVTSDRDEKIRVSHYPNCYNIEAFALGHRDFITGVHLFADAFLLSASGDGTVATWSFPQATRIDSLRLPGCAEGEPSVLVILDVHQPSSTVACRVESAGKFAVVFVRLDAHGRFATPPCSVVDVERAPLAGLFDSADGRSFFVSLAGFPGPRIVELARNTADDWHVKSDLSPLPAAIAALPLRPVAEKLHADLEFELSPLRFQKFDQVKQPNSKKPPNKQPRWK